MKPESLKKMEKIRQEARQRILDRGKVEFRCEPELLSEILDLSAKNRIAVGPMIRQWVKDRVDREINVSTDEQSQLDKIEQKLNQVCEHLSNYKVKNI
jgi:hypothetical protein